MNLSDTKDAVHLATGVITLIGVIGGFLSWIHIRGRNLIRKQLEIIQREISPNGGKSLNDAIKRIEMKVDRVYAGLHFVLSVTDEAVWETDPEGRCKWASPALCQMFGLSQPDMQGYGWLDGIATQEERELVAHGWNEAVRQRIPYSKRYTIHNRQTGEKSVVESRGWPCVDEIGNPTWYYGTCVKIHPFNTRETEIDTEIVGMRKDVR